MSKLKVNSIKPTSGTDLNVSSPLTTTNVLIFTPTSIPPITTGKIFYSNGNFYFGNNNNQ